MCNCYRNEEQEQARTIVTFVTFVLGLTIGSLLVWIFTPIHVDPVPPVSVEPRTEDVVVEDVELLEWSCVQVVTCPRVDWRHNEPEDVCTYERTTEKSVENPAVHTAYGAHCELVK